MGVFFGISAEQSLSPCFENKVSLFSFFWLICLFNCTCVIYLYLRSRTLTYVQGSSDSALCFAMFINDLPVDPTSQLSCDELRLRLEKVILDLEAIAERDGLFETSMLNFVLTDGVHTICTRYIRDPNQIQLGAATLYFSAGTGYQCIDGPARPLALCSSCSNIILFLL